MRNQEEEEKGLYLVESEELNYRRNCSRRDVRRAISGSNVGIGVEELETHALKFSNLQKRAFIDFQIPCGNDLLLEGIPYPISILLLV